MRTLALLILALLGPLEASGQRGFAGLDLSRYAAPARLVDIGGRRLNLFCLGSGSPTVVFQTQLGEAAWGWALVHAEVAKHARACVYDRAGLGFSEPSIAPGTAMHAANDMKELLDRAEERPPYLLVGASYGALVARYFATKYPGSVSAMVLVDGHHEDEFDRINKLSGGKYALMMASVEEHHQNCLAASRRHISPRSPEYTSCVPPPPSFANRRLTAVNLSQFLSPHYWESALSEWQSLHAASTQQVRSLDEKLTSIPVVALVRSVSPFAIPGRPPSALNRAVERENAKMQQETASLSLFGRTVVIPQAGHAIHLDNPRVVIQQVLLVHRSVRL